MSQNNENGLMNYTANAPGGITVSLPKSRQAIEVMNNKSRYYADLAKQYKDEAKEYRDSARTYAEENADVTMLYVNELEARLQRGIDGKQASGDYALNSSIPTNVSDLTNDSGYITNSALSPYQLITQDMTSLSASGSISLSDNTINKISATGSVTFTLPSVTDLTKFHQIFVQLYMASAQTIDLGTTYYFNNEAPDLSEAGTYDLIFEYDNTASHWVVGCLSKGAVS